VQKLTDLTSLLYLTTFNGATVDSKVRYFRKDLEDEENENKVMRISYSFCYNVAVAIGSNRKRLCTVILFCTRKFDKDNSVITPLYVSLHVYNLCGRRDHERSNFFYVHRLACFSFLAATYSQLQYVRY